MCTPTQAVNFADAGNSPERCVIHSVTRQHCSSSNQSSNPGKMSLPVFTDADRVFIFSCRLRLNV
ncbi:hypothetical protein GHT06_014663 [Daphnia sinensis]|uniref:Uncharacterized protein n=1 Tax=Daphnia sinensis TaxID=1820382 RepID=A0AAD5PS74_9CRUS|nr:hypothetical protein GHT06_014663 [Daphnia sinensis]